MNEEVNDILVVNLTVAKGCQIILNIHVRE